VADFTTPEEVRAVYRARARHYDLTAKLYYLAGFREQHFRKMAVEALGLKPGGTVVEIGCGTGLNFPLLQQKVGRAGRIIGVDLTDAMLAQARKRAAANGWNNVELVESSAAAYRFPPNLDGILSTFALTLDADYDKVIASSAKALKPGARWVVLDIKLPSNWIRHLTPLLILLLRPFAVSEALAARHPWESIGRHLTNTSMRELFFGIAYLAVGERPSKNV
jgi:demethylmenaquinone methyltransferase/2-methoxy-6-polyprenyl-1,4-benzoquinol methylase